MSSATLLTARIGLPGAECFLNPTAAREVPAAPLLEQLDVRSRVASGPRPQSVTSGLIGGLQAPRALTRFVGAERAVVMGQVPRAIAAQLAVSNDAMPPGDPVLMSFALTERGQDVVAEHPTFHWGVGDHARRERAYAFAESRAQNQALGALLDGASAEALRDMPIAVRARAYLADIARFEQGPEPSDAPGRLVHRSARVTREQAVAIARALGPTYDCDVEPRLPAMTDEVRERPIAAAFLAVARARGVDPALLYAVMTADGMPREVDAWHRGIAGLELPSQMSIILGETATRLAQDRDASKVLVRNLLPARAGEVDARVETFLALLRAEGGDARVTRYLRERAGKAMLPSSEELRDPGVARAFSRTAIWEQLRSTGIFEGL